MMRLTILVAAVVGCLAAAPVPMYKADPSLEGEMALPPLSLAPGLKLDDRWLIPSKYHDLPGDAPLRKALRETQVLRLVRAAYSNREIARELVLSNKTVGRHLENIFAKLGVSSRVAALAMVAADGVIAPR